MSLRGKLKGSVVDERNFQDLVFARLRIDGIKLRKLFERHNKHGKDSEETFYSILHHLVGEVEELREAVALEDSQNILEELADVSNCADILAMVLMK